MLSRNCLISILISLSFAFLISCASFPGKDLSRYTYDQIKTGERKPSIDYEVKFYSMGQENAGAVGSFQVEIEKVFEESEVFQRFSAGIGSERYHLKLVLENEGNVGVAVTTGILCGLTLTLLPAYARDEFILTVDVYEGEKLLKQYQYEHYVNSWIQLFLIFISPFYWPGTVIKEAIDDMLLNFLYDLENDEVLSGIPLVS